MVLLAVTQTSKHRCLHLLVRTLRIESSACKQQRPLQERTSVLTTAQALLRRPRLTLGDSKTVSLTTLVLFAFELNCKHLEILPQELFSVLEQEPTFP